MKKAWNRLQEKFEEDPVVVMVAAAGVMTASAMLINAVANANRSRSWAKEVNRRERMIR